MIPQLAAQGIEIANHTLHHVHADMWNMTLPPKLTIPDEALDIARALDDAGHEVWCVGGAIRDALLGAVSGGTPMPPADMVWLAAISASTLASENCCMACGLSRVRPAP
jgi:hypothetical protein